MAIILIDVDDVTLDLLTYWVELYNKDYDDNLTSADFTEWDMTKVVKPACGKKIYDYLLIPDLYERVMPIAGAVEGIAMLREWGHRPVFVSSGIHRGKYLRLKQFGLVNSESDYVCAHDKSLIKGKYLIDDGSHNVLAFAPYGTAILYDTPHNQELDWEYRVHGWLEVLQTIGKLESENPFVKMRTNERSNVLNER